MYKYLTEDKIKDILKASPIEEIGYMGNGLYYCGNGLSCGKQGWKEFNKSCEKYVNERYNATSTNKK